MLQRAGVPFARTATTAVDAWRLVAAVGFPLFAKPRAGHGSIGARMIRDERDLHAALAGRTPSVIQEFLASDEDRRGEPVSDPIANGLCQENEYSIQLLVGHEARLLGHFASRNRLEHGAPMLVEVIDDTVIGCLAADVARTLGGIGLLGPCNVQARRVGGRYIVFEVNARFTGITPVRARMGFNDVEAAYGYFVEGVLPEPFPVFDTRQVAVRHLTESVFSIEQLDELTRHGRWRPTS
jgi:carbamoylphosphate synthase large subunit